MYKMRSYDPNKNILSPKYCSVTFLLSHALLGIYFINIFLGHLTKMYLSSFRKKALHLYNSELEKIINNAFMEC